MDEETRQRLISPVRRLYVPIVSILLVLLVGSWWAHSSRFDPLTAAQNPRIRFQRLEDALDIHGDGVSSAEAALARGVLPGSGGKGTATAGHQLIYVGNSQTLAIMDRQKNDMISAQWLQVLLARQTDHERSLLRVRLESLPNLTMGEILLKLIATGQQVPAGGTVLLGSLVLEEFRFLSIRDEVLASLRADGVKSVLMDLMTVNSDLRFGVRAVEGALGAAAARGGEESRETGDPHGFGLAGLGVQLWAAVDKFPLAARRSELYGEMVLAYYRLRNRLLHITSATARPVPKPAYQANLEILELALRYAQRRGVQVILYLGPIRSIQPNRNTPEDIARFRQDIPALCRAYKATCLDYTDLIPPDLWTKYPDEDIAAGGQPDFAHFTGPGHKLLAERLMADVGPLLLGRGRNPKADQP